MAINFPPNPKDYESHVDFNGNVWRFQTPSWWGIAPPFVIPTDGVFVFETTAAAESITLPLVNGASYTFVVDWGDGNTDTITTWDQAEKTHQYALAGSHSVSINGICEQLSFALDPTSATKLKSVERLGHLAWTSLSGTFKGCTSLTSVITHLTDTSLVTDVSSFLEGCTSLIDLDVTGEFDSTLVTDYTSFLKGCTAIASVDLSELVLTPTNVASMFQDCSALATLNLTGMDSSLVTDFSNIFNGCTGFLTLDVSVFDVSSGLNFSNMFTGMTGLTTLDVSSFVPTSGTNFSYMFSGMTAATSFNLTGFNAAAGLNFSYMFDGCTALAALDADLITTVGTDFSYMFNNCSALLTLDVSSFSTAAALDMSYMFKGCLVIPSFDVTGFVTSSATTFEGMFQSCRAITGIDVSGFTTTLVTNMSYMFQDCILLQTLDFNTFDVGNATTLSHMFDGDAAFDPTNLDLADVTSLLDATNFMRDANLISIADYDAVLVAWSLQVVNAAVVIHFGDVQYTESAARTILDTTNTWVITDGGKLPDHDFVTTWTTDNASEEAAFPLQLNDGLGHDYVYDFTVDWGDGTPIETISAYQARVNHTYTDAGTYQVRMSGTCERVYFFNDAAKNRLKSVDNLGSMGWYYVNKMFYTCYQLTSFTVGTAVLPNLTSLVGMFDLLSALTTLDITGLETGILTDISLMFQTCSGLTSISGLSVIDTSSVTDASGMFKGAANIISLDLSTWDFSSIETISNMFHTCYDLTTLSLPDFTNSSSLTTMLYAFYSCISLGSLDFGTANFTSLSTLQYTFQSCTTLTSIDFGAVTGGALISIQRAFDNCYDLVTADLSGFTFSNLTDASYAFNTCYDLTTVDFGNANSPDFSSVTSTAYMFEDCYVNLASTSMFNNVSFGSATTPCSLTSMFKGCTAITSTDFFTANTLKYVTNMGSLFYSSKMATIDMTNADLNDCTLLGSVFQNNNVITSINMTGVKLPNATNMASMVYGCTALQTLTLTGIVTGVALNNIGSMMYNCAALTFANVDQLNITGVQYMANFANFANLWPNSQYDDALVAWAAQGGIPLIQAAHFGDAKYTEAVARADLVADGWGITDGGAL